MIHLGEKAITQIKCGAKNIVKVMLGNQCVWQSAKPVEYIFSTSKQFKIPRGYYSADIFLVGGGGGGGGCTRNGGRFTGMKGGGGAGGYTARFDKIKVSAGKEITIAIGAGGVGGDYYRSTTQLAKNGGTGGQSYVMVNDIKVAYANGGGGGHSYDASSNSNGGNGGTGGSGGYYTSTLTGAGQSNGANGQTTNAPIMSGGTGQKTTTRAWGDTALELYSGSGAGGGHWQKQEGGDKGYNAPGGAGGGGRSGCAGAIAPGAGVANTGGGGGGAGPSFTRSGTISTVALAGGKGGSGLIRIRLYATHRRPDVVFSVANGNLKSG